MNLVIQSLDKTTITKLWSWIISICFHHHKRDERIHQRMESLCFIINPSPWKQRKDMKLTLYECYYVLVWIQKRMILEQIGCVLKIFPFYFNAIWLRKNIWFSKLSWFKCFPKISFEASHCICAWGNKAIQMH